jgi:error-prone DNA polymerase
MFQIESPGQRELVGKFGPQTFEDIIIDISLFRPGPVKSDMVTPFLMARNGWRDAVYPHPDLEFALAETAGVVVFHEQVLQVVARMTGCTLAEADEVRRALGEKDAHPEVRAWFVPRALSAGYPVEVAEQVWTVLAAFGSFGFCKAHAAAFALPTYQSAWLKTHHPAAFLAGVLTHDPGMYPKRLILDDARQFGITILGLDVNASDSTFVVERLDDDACGIRIALSEVKGISDSEVTRIVAGRPYQSLTDFWHRAGVSRPVVERLVLAGGFDSIYGITESGSVPHRGAVTRRDLLLQVADLDRYTRAVNRSARGTRRRSAVGGPQRSGVWGQAQAQSQATLPVEPVQSVQLTLELADAPADALHTGEVSGLPEMDPGERVRAELEVLGLDTSRHIVEFYDPFLDELGVVRSRDLLAQRSKSEMLVAGVKVATQTPPIRSGRRVVFLTLDDGTGPVDLTFFEDALGPYATTVFHSWLLVVRGELRRTGRRGVSLRATGCWELVTLHEAWRRDGPAGARAVMVPASGAVPEEEPSARRVLVHSTGFKLSPYADIKPAGEATGTAPRKLWHSSPGSSGA